jgi:uncharacterized protein (DUF4415 family)
MNEPKQKRQPKPPIDKDGEIRELTLAEIRKMKPIREAMPELIEAVNAYRSKGGRPRSEAPKVHIGFRLAADLVASIKATGPGYNARVEDALRAAFIKTEPTDSRPSSPLRKRGHSPRRNPIRVGQVR